VIGGIWWSWHLPELISVPAGQPPALPFLVVVVSQSMLLAWLYNSTRGSLPIVMIFHAAFDTTGRTCSPRSPASSTSPRPGRSRSCTRSPQQPAPGARDPTT